MYLLGIICSPRAEGNTEILVKEALEKAREIGAETEILRIADLKISPCDGCESCHTTGVCKIDDDMHTVYEKLLKADGVILGSPVYFWTISTQTKILINRTYALRYPTHRLKNKVCGAIVVAGRRGSTGALSVINNFFLGQDMLPVGLGIAGYALKKGDVEKDERAMNGTRSIGRQICELIKVIKSES